MTAAYTLIFAHGNGERPSALEWLGFELAVRELLELRAGEARLLRVLAEARGETVSFMGCRRRLASRFSGHEPLGRGVLAVYASRVRTALKDVGQPEAMPATAKGQGGYRVCPRAVRALWSMIGERL